MTARFIRRSERRSEKGGVLVKLVVLLLVLAAAIVLAWMLFLPWGVARTLSQRSGFPTGIRSLAVNPATGAFSGGGLRVENPATLGGGTFFSVADFAGKAEMGTLDQPELVIEELSIDLTQLLVQIDAQGRSNAEAFGEALARHVDQHVPRYAHAGIPLSAAELPKAVVVRTLHLRVGRVDVVSADPRMTGRWGEQLDFEGTFHDVRRWQDLLTPEVVQRLAQSPALWQALIDSGVLPREFALPGALQQLLRGGGDLFKSFFRTLEQ